jgi:dihydroorotate dehydrogenase electron transfer subunit
MSHHHPPYRGSILVEDAEVLSQTSWPGGQYVIVLRSPRIAARATPGAFVHLTCDPELAMRRPLSLQRANPTAGTLEILYKIVGEGTRRLANARPGEMLSCMGPIGRGFTIDEARPRALLVGGGVGLPPMIYLAESMASSPGQRPFVVLGSEIPFPFTPRPSTLLIDGIPEGVIASHPLLESWGIASRLASGAGFAGCHQGYVTDLASRWLETLTSTTLREVMVYACGPTPMLRAVARMAQRFGLPAQVSLEEFMACAVGGCAGCAIEVVTPTGPAMKRVCVDGPVFDADSVFPPTT